MNHKTYSPQAKDIHRSWHLIDLKDQVLGRISTQIAHLLQGKHKPTYAPHLDSGDFVVAVNASQIKLTGKKMLQKTYFRHSGFPGGARTTPIAAVMATAPGKIITTAVAGMLPKNRLRDPRLNRLKVFSGPDQKYSDKLKSKEN